MNTTSLLIAPVLALSLMACSTTAPNRPVAGGTTLDAQAKSSKPPKPSPAQFRYNFSGNRTSGGYSGDPIGPYFMTLTAAQNPDGSRTLTGVAEVGYNRPKAVLLLSKDSLSATLTLTFDSGEYLNFKGTRASTDFYDGTYSGNALGGGSGRLYPMP